MTPPPKTLAELKRLPVGTPLLLKQTLLGSCHKYRQVAGHQSNAVLFEGEGINGRHSYLWLPKAKDFIPLENGFAILEDGECAARYEMV